MSCFGKCAKTVEDDAKKVEDEIHKLFTPEQIQAMEKMVEDKIAALFPPAHMEPPPKQ